MRAIIAFITHYVRFKVTKADLNIGYTRVIHITMGPVSIHLGISKVTIG